MREGYAHTSMFIHLCIYLFIYLKVTNHLLIKFEFKILSCKLCEHRQTD